MKALLVQLKEELVRFDVQKEEIETLFIGGGTPSCLEPSAYVDFFDMIKPFMAKDTEITSEANPNSADKSWLEGMYALGVNRLSFGVQSFHHDKLAFLNRAHTPTQAQEAIQLADKIGFKNLSLDLIYGCSLDTKANLQEDLNIAFSLPINHLSAYSLTIEENTPFFQTPQVSQDDEEMAFWFTKKIQERFKQYEISNFGTPPSLHNSGYWRYHDYIGVGSGAIGFLKNRRFYTQKDVQAYIQNPLKIEVENLSAKDIQSEKVLLGLRSDIGIFEDDLEKSTIKNAHFLVSQKKLRYHDKTFYNDNFFLADALALYVLS
jgi:oxygen-independent coproporphyrinogen-3 oxidase